MNLRDYMKTSQAAEFLGVSPGTVRNWENQGRLRAKRLAHNDYRLFLRADLEDFLFNALKPSDSPQCETGLRQAGQRS